MSGIHIRCPLTTNTGYLLLMMKVSSPPSVFSDTTPAVDCSVSLQPAHGGNLGTLSTLAGIHGGETTVSVVVGWNRMAIV